VVIFKAQEQLKRASEPSVNPNTSRALLNESLKLFQRVAGSLTQTNLESAVQQYIAVRYYAGAIHLCLTVATEKDRGNSALSWVNEGKPASDPRAKAFDERKTCYNLIHHILQDLDAASSREPDMVDGRPTLIATKRAEAYDVVSGSSDEVFHFDLYDWYIQQGWTDRLLGIESPHVTTFLRRLASQNFEHADLLCRFYTMRGMYFDASKVQSDLAKSDFAISIKDRLTLLSKAKTNASVMTTGVSRQEQQLLNHEVTELLEVAHIQDDLLERLKIDDRVPADRKVQVQNDLDGQIQGLSEVSKKPSTVLPRKLCSTPVHIICHTNVLFQLFNTYADQAGYYDLCLLIYHAADFRNAATISQTWASLIQQTHENIVEQWATYTADRKKQPSKAGSPPPQPYETLIGQIQEVCHRSSNDSFIFPVPTLLPELCRYAYENGQDARINADVNWPVLLFLNLGVSHDLVVRVLEQMFEAQEVPFRGPVARARVVEWIVCAVSRWVNELGRHGRPDARLEAWVAELMSECESLVAGVRGVNEGGVDLRDLTRSVREVKNAVEGFVGPGLGSMRGSLGFY
jgi:nuclear pore complex protein Nup155